MIDLVRAGRISGLTSPPHAATLPPASRELKIAGREARGGRAALGGGRELVERHHARGGERVVARDLRTGSACATVRASHGHVARTLSALAMGLAGARCGVTGERGGDLRTEAPETGGR
jgi:hypothetical protein